MESEGHKGPKHRKLEKKIIFDDCMGQGYIKVISFEDMKRGGPGPSVH